MNRRNALKTLLAGLAVPFVGLPERIPEVEWDVVELPGDLSALDFTSDMYDEPMMSGPVYVQMDDYSIYRSDDFYDDAPGGPTWIKVEV